MFESPKVFIPWEGRPNLASTRLETNAIDLTSDIYPGLKSTDTGDLGLF